MDITGGVPGYVDMFVSTCNYDVEKFECQINEQVAIFHINLNKAVKTMEWDVIKDSIVINILGITTRNRLDCDRQYFVQEKVGGIISIPCSYYNTMLSSRLVEMCQRK
jgi:hypothetical protein